MAYPRRGDVIPLGFSGLQPTAKTMKLDVAVVFATVAVMGVFIIVNSRQVVIHHHCSQFVAVVVMVPAIVILIIVAVALHFHRS